MQGFPVSKARAEQGFDFHLADICAEFRIVRKRAELPESIMRADENLRLKMPEVSQELFEDYYPALFIVAGNIMLCFQKIDGRNIFSMYDRDGTLLYRRAI